VEKNPFAQAEATTSTNNNNKNKRRKFTQNESSNTNNNNSTDSTNHDNNNNSMPSSPSAKVDTMDEMTKRLEFQREAEKEAEKRGHFAEKQRVLYYHKATGQYFDSVIVGVHYDDGPDTPYYTIKYTKPNIQISDDGAEVDTPIEMEKQTNPDRLQRLEWDQKKTEHILKST